MIKDKLPLFRITVELIEPGSEIHSSASRRLTVYSRDTNHVSGEVWMHARAPRHSFDISSGDFIVNVGTPGTDIHHIAEIISRSRA